MKVQLPILFFFFIFFLNLSHSLLAMESSRYQMQISNLDFDDQQTADSAPLYFNSDSEKEAFNLRGYFVRTGYQYPNSLENPLIISLKGANIDFSNVLPNNPKTAKIEINSTFIGTNQFQIGLISDDRFKTMEGNYLENTKCDNGHNKCSILLARAWDSNSSYGFGYNITKNLLPDFINQDYYRPLTTRNNKAEPIYFEPDLNFKDNQKITINFKININSAQPKGNYKSIIDFIVSPPF